MTKLNRIAAALAFATVAATSAIAAPQTYVVEGTHTYPRFFVFTLWLLDTVEPL